MREYETTFIVQPEISDEGAQAIVERLEKTLADKGETRLYLEDLGKRKLAFEINKFHKGHYFVLGYLGTGASVPELERALRLDESVLRFMTILANPSVGDVEARKTWAAEFEADQARRAAEKAAREAEEAQAREEAERTAASEAAEQARHAEEAGDVEDESDEDEDSDRPALVDEDEDE